MQSGKYNQNKIKNIKKKLVHILKYINTLIHIIIFQVIFCIISKTPYIQK